MWNLTKLVSSLNKVCNDLDHIYNINEGGCCYLAYLISLYLDKYNIKYSLIISSTDKKDINKCISEVKNHNRNYSKSQSILGYGTCDHYYLLVDNIGYINQAGYENDIFIKDINSLDIKWIYKEGYWNSVYNTNLNRRIRKKINSLFERYERSRKV